MSDSLRSRIDAWYTDWFAMDRLYYDWARARGVTDTVLFCLYEMRVNQPYCTAGQIAASLALSKQTINSALDRLEERGLIRREIDPTDRRNRTLHFTPLGREYAGQLLAELDTAEQAAFLALPEKDLQVMMETNRRLVELLRQRMR